MLSASNPDDTIAWYENVNGDRSLWTRRVISTEADLYATSVFGAMAPRPTSVDGDGDVDGMSASYSDDTIAWYENVNGDGSTWTRRVISTTSDDRSFLNLIPSQ